MVAHPDPGVEHDPLLAAVLGALPGAVALIDAEGRFMAASPAFPLDVLRQMVVASGKATQENTLKYMRALVEMYQSAFRAMSPALGPFDFMRPLSGRTPSTPQPQAWEDSGEETIATASGEPESREVQELRQRLEELEGMVRRLKHKNTTGRPNSKPHRKR